MVPSFMLQMRNLFQMLLSSLYTLFPFSKSDALLAVSMLTSAMILTGPTNISNFLVACLWVELHLLAFEIKNQLIGIEEDKICKPDRPFAAGRISPSQGQALYCLVIAMAFAMSTYHGLFNVSFVYCLAIWAYNECRLSANALAKSPLSATGYMCYCWGAAYIIGNHQPLNRTSITSILASGAIFTLTGHAQDFRDRSGDALLGRKTIPLILPPGIARWSLMMLIFSLTYGIIKLWNPPIIPAVIYVSIAIVCSSKFVADHSEAADRNSFRWYELWSICAYVLPIFTRLSNNGETSSLSLTASVDALVERW